MDVFINLLATIFSGLMVLVVPGLAVLGSVVLLTLMNLAIGDRESLGLPASKFGRR